MFGYGANQNSGLRGVRGDPAHASASTIADGRLGATLTKIAKTTTPTNHVTKIRKQRQTATLRDKSQQAHAQTNARKQTRQRWKHTGTHRQAWEQVKQHHLLVLVDGLGIGGHGNPCCAGNYLLCWEKRNGVFTYRVLGKWPEDLWKAHKLQHPTYESYLWLCRDNVVSRKRNLDAVRDREERVSLQQTLADRETRIRSNTSLFKPFARVPVAEAWLEQFKNDALRYPILVVHGKSRCGKTEWANSLFKAPLELKIGAMSHFPDGMRQFDRRVHDGIVLDDVRDLAFIVQHQEKLQGKYNRLVEFASTPGGQCAYAKDLYAVPIVCTINDSTEHRELLTEDDWLGNVGNRVLVYFESSVPTVG